MMKFIQKQEIVPKNYSLSAPEEIVILETHAVALEDVLDAMRRFLIAAGYMIEGDLDVIPPVNDEHSALRTKILSQETELALSEEVAAAARALCATSDPQDPAYARLRRALSSLDMDTEHLNEVLQDE